MKTLSPPAGRSPRRPGLIAALLALGALSASALQAASDKPAGGASAGSVRPGEPVTLNFVNADIEAVARTMATLTGRNVVLDPRVKGSLTLSAEHPVSPARAFDQFLAALRLQGYTVVESAGLYKLVPEAEAKLQGGAVVAEAGPGSAGGQIVTQIFKLNHENAQNLVPVLRPLISPNNTINLSAGNNALVITDYADNLQRLARIVSALDVANASDVDVIALRHAIASDLAPLVQKLVDGGAPSSAAAGSGGVDSGFKTTVLAEPRSNSLIVRAANPARVALVKALAQKLDQAPEGSANGAAGNIYVVYLKNADATRLAVTLRAALASASGNAAGSGAAGAISAVSTLATGTPGSAGVAPGGSAGTSSTAGVGLGASALQPSTGGQIQADPATNSLIISAPEPQYRQLRAVIDKLDGRRAQVFVESLIAEVNADKAAQFGVQWQNVLGNKGDASLGLIGTNFGSGSSGGTNIVNLATQGASGAVVPAQGLNLAWMRNVNGHYVLGALANFLQTSGDGNVLSTPNLLTLDNEEARIIIGQNVPFVTGQYTNNNANGATVNPFQTIERKDVGLTLRVRPQISENGTVKLAIYQEVSSVAPTSVNASTGLITNKRSIESNVLVEDGSIVVLGGLLQDEYAGSQDKVPGLGDMPLLGALFRSDNRSRKKTNLMVFLRPVVVRDAQSTEALSLSRYELMRGTQQAQSQSQTQSASPVLPLGEAAVLPEPASRLATPAR